MFKERRQRKEQERRAERLETSSFRAVTTDHDARRGFIWDDFGVITAVGRGEDAALAKLAEKAKTVGANTVVALRFAVDGEFTTAYGTARLYS